jgi:hypothetical protein
LGGFEGTLANGAANAAIGGGAGVTGAGLAIAIFGSELVMPVVGWIIAGITAAVAGFLDLFGFNLFGGGGQAPIIPNGYYRMVHHLYKFITGAPYPLTPDQKSSIPYEGPFHGRVIWVEGPGWIPGLTRPFWGYKYCGAGNYPGSPTSDTDKCCEAHDNCYAAHGLSSNNVSVLHPGKGIGAAQAGCDQDLCYCVNDLGEPQTIDENLLQHGITGLFCHSMY